MIAKKKGNFRVIPYSEAYEEALLELERVSPQGFLMKLETLRTQFLSRATLFDAYAAYLVLGENDKIIASGIGAQVPLCLHNTTHQAGFGFDMLVDSAYQNMGVGRELARYVKEHFFMPRGLSRQFTILKASNMPMLHILSKSYRSTSLYQFLYLTFPTARTIRIDSDAIGDYSFGVDLLSGKDRLADYYQITDSGLGLWHTYKIYQLRVKFVNPVLSGGLRLGNRLIRTNKFVPETGAVLKTVTLFNLNKDNIHTLPEVSLQLYQQGINYMQICCQPSDAVYRALHKSALNAFSHYLVSTEALNPSEELRVDVRCL